MLILTRAICEALQIGDNIKVRIKNIKGNKVSIGIDASEDIEILREELLGFDEKQS